MANKVLTKAQKEARKQIKRERITVGFRDDPDSLVQIPRFKLTPEHINKAFNVEVEYLVDDTGGVVYPDKFIYECMPPPFTYFIVEKELTEPPFDDGRDPCYVGETQVVVWNVPLQVTLEDLDCWIKRGVQETDERFSTLLNRIEETKDKLEQNQERLNNVPFMTTKSETEKGKAEERRLVMKTLQRDREKLNAELAQAEEAFKAEQKRRNAKSLNLQLVESDEKRKLSIWHVTFSSEGEARRAVDFDRWTSLKLIPGFKSKHEFREPVAQFNDIEDDGLREDSINMRGVVLQRIRHGRGAYTDWQWGDAYTGEFKHGLRCGKGKLFDRIGEYRGEFKDDYRFGNGVQHFANGEKYEGEYGYTTTHDREPKIMPHHFKVGKMHGMGTYSFADGSYFKGEFRNGVITGQGKYHNPNTGELMEGFFLDGRLHGPGLHITQQGERLEGTFRDGMLHGNGTWESRPRKSDGGLKDQQQRPERFRDRSRCVGTWFNGEPHGKCLYEHRKGYTYRGYYMDGLRSGPGSMIYGRVHPQFDKTTGKMHLKHDFEYQGMWLAGRLRARGLHVKVRDRMLPSEKEEKVGLPGYELELRNDLYYTTNFKSWAMYPFLHRLVFQEEASKRRRFMAVARRERIQSKLIRTIAGENLATFKRERKIAIELYKKVFRAYEHYEMHPDGGGWEEEESEEEFYRDEDGESDEEKADFDDGASFYYDSDWYSVGNNGSQATDANIIRNNPQYRGLKITLADILQDPPQKDKSGHSTVRQAMEHYGVRAKEAELQKLKRMYKQAS